MRVGNLAATQTQIDVYGEIVGRPSPCSPRHAWHQRAGRPEFQLEMLCRLERIWQDPDHGIWEVRGDRQHFVNSKVMASVAFDRAIKTIEHFKLDGPLERWRTLRQAIHDNVCRYGFNPELGAFVQSYGSKHLDASALLIPLVGFSCLRIIRERAARSKPFSGTWSLMAWCGATTARPELTACRRVKECSCRAVFGWRTI